MEKAAQMTIQMADVALKLREEVESYPGIRARSALQKVRNSLRDSKKKHDQIQTGWSLLQMGMVLRGQRRHELAIKVLEQSRAIFSLLRINLGLATALYEHSFCCRELGKNKIAAEIGRLGVQLFQDLGRTRDLAWAYDNMSVIAANLCDRHESLSYAKKARAIFTEFNSSVGLAWNACNLGVLYTEMGFFTQAEKLFSEAIRIFKKLDNAQGKAWAIMGIATIYQSEYRFSLAENHFKKAITIYKELDLKDRVAYCLLHQAAIRRTVGRDEEAILINKRAIQLFTTVKSSEGVAWALLQLGQILRDHGQYIKAWQTLRESLNLHTDISHQKGMGWAGNELGRTYLALSDLTHARECFIKAKVIGEKLDDGPMKAAVAKNLAHLHLDEGYLQKGITILEDCSLTAEKIQAAEVEAESYLERVRYCFMVGDFKKARFWINMVDNVVEEKDIHRLKPLVGVYLAEALASEGKINSAQNILDESQKNAKKYKQKEVKVMAQLGLIQILVFNKKPTAIESMLNQIEKDIRFMGSRKLKAKFLIVKGMAQYKIWGNFDDRCFDQAVNILRASGLPVLEKIALGIQLEIFSNAKNSKEQFRSKNDIKELLDRGPVDLHLVRPSDDPNFIFPLSLVI